MSNVKVDVFLDNDGCGGGFAVALVNHFTALGEKVEVESRRYKDDLLKLGGADSVLLANTIKERYAKLNA